MMPPPPPRITLSRRDTKAVLLWAARQIAGEGGEGLYAGPVRVRVEKAGESEAVEVRSSRGCDGMELPEGVGVKAVAAETPESGGDGESELVGALTVDALLANFFSRDEVRILSEMVGGKPVKATAVMDAARVEKSKFWPLWSNLQQRGIVDDAEEGEGFVIRLAWVAEWIKQKRAGGATSAA
jgi:hypothetical protein